MLDELLDLPEERRLAQLRTRHTEDLAVLAEVESLLRAAHASGGFLDSLARPPADDLPDAAIGTRLGAWNITRLIGHGGMGDVHEATRAEGAAGRDLAESGKRRRT